MQTSPAVHQRRSRASSVAVGVIAALLLWASVGCSRAARIEKANDELRQENATLKDQVTDLTARNKELQAQLHQASAPPSTLPEEIRENTPYVTAITVGRLSFARDTNGDGQPDTLTIYINPTDGRGRFTQMVGTLSISAAVLPANADARTIGRATFAPSQVRDGYRSALTGTYYVFDVPIDLTGSTAATPDRAMVAAEYIDGVTGEKFSAERSVSLK